MLSINTLKDFVYYWNNLSENLEDGNLLAALGHWFVHSFQFLIESLTHFDWLKSISYIPLFVPAFPSTDFTWIFENQSTYLPFISQENGIIPFFGPFLLGLCNSLFLCLPLSCSWLLAIRRGLIQGKYAGFCAGVGTMLANWLFLGSVLFGWRWAIMPTILFGPIPYVVGLAFMWFLIVDQLATKESLAVVLPNRKKQLSLILLINFCFAWVEEGCVFGYMGRLSFGPEPTFFEPVLGLPSNLANFQTFFYWAGIGIGGLLLSIFIAWISFNTRLLVLPWWREKNPYWLPQMNQIALTLALGVGISAFPSHGAELFFLSPTGMYPMDSLTEKTNKLKPFWHNQGRDSLKRKYHGSLGKTSRDMTLGIDFIGFDRASYKSHPTHRMYALPFEDSNFGGDFVDNSRYSRWHARNWIKKRYDKRPWIVKARKKIYDLLGGKDLISKPKGDIVEYMQNFNKRAQIKATNEILTNQGERLLVPFERKQFREPLTSTFFWSTRRFELQEKMLKRPPIRRQWDKSLLLEEKDLLGNTTLKNEEQTANGFVGINPSQGKEKPNNILTKQLSQPSVPSFVKSESDKRFSTNLFPFSVGPFIRFRAPYPQSTVLKNKTYAVCFNEPNLAFKFVIWQPSQLQVRVFRSWNRKGKAYTNKLYRGLLATDIDMFLNRYPKEQRQTLLHNKQLSLYAVKRALESYTGTVRAYQDIVSPAAFKLFFKDSKSFADKTYKHQFKGTYERVSQLFALRTLPKVNISGRPTLAYDINLYKPLSGNRLSFLHEEAIPRNTFLNKKAGESFSSEEDKNLSLKGNSTSSAHSFSVERYPFPTLVESSAPFYLGTDPFKKRVVITARTLPRIFAGRQFVTSSKRQIRRKTGQERYLSVWEKYTSWPVQNEHLLTRQGAWRSPSVFLKVLESKNDREKEMTTSLTTKQKEDLTQILQHSKFTTETDKSVLENLKDHYSVNPSLAKKVFSLKLSPELIEQIKEKELRAKAEQEQAERKKEDINSTLEEGTPVTLKEFLEYKSQSLERWPEWQGWHTITQTSDSRRKIPKLIQDRFVWALPGIVVRGQEVTKKGFSEYNIGPAQKPFSFEKGFALRNRARIGGYKWPGTVKFERKQNPVLPLTKLLRGELSWKTIKQELLKNQTSFSSKSPTESPKE